MPATPTNVSASDGVYRDGILVTWTYSGDLAEVGRWDIYRWKDGEIPKFYRSVFGGILQYADFLNVPGFSQDPTAKYNYAVKAYSYTTGSSAISASDSGYIAPNNAPVFSSPSISVTTNEDQSKQVDLNATDKDGDALQYSIEKLSQYGSLLISGSSITYKPKENFNGQDSFTVKAYDSWGGYSTQVINVIVNPVNDNPIFLSNLINQNNKLIAKSSGSTVFRLSAFDIDGDGGTFSFENVVYGRVSISGDTITYTPSGSSIKSDSFEVTVSDGNGGIARQKIDVVIDSPSIPSSSLLPLSGSSTVDMMLNGYRWYGNTIYYSFSLGMDYSVPNNPSKFEQDLKFIFETAFGVYLDIQFVFVGFFESPEYAYYSGSNINIALDSTNFISSSTFGHANFPVPNIPLSTFPSNYRGSEGDVFININGPANFLTYEPGAEGFLLLLHEIGHALGLKHPHDDGGSGRPTFVDLNLNQLNIDWWTVMSYKDDSISQYYWDPTTPMVLDIIALQYLYGSSSNAAGNNVYDLRFNLPAYFTIFDSAGTDILDFRNAAEAIYVELPKLWISSFQEYPIGIALPLNDLNRTAPTYLTWLYGDFEELQGSAYSDIIVGSEKADKIFGNAGNDEIRGGSASDIIDGGFGMDTAFFADLFSECTVTFEGDQCIIITKSEGIDKLVNVEKLTFGPIGGAVEYSLASLKNRNPAFATSSQSTSTNEDSAKTITVSATDTDGDLLTYTISTTATNGTAVISGSTVTYTPKTNYNGSDSFAITASDGNGGTATQTVNVTVIDVNDAPIFSSPSQSVSATAGSAKTITLSAVDVDGDMLAYNATFPSKGSVAISGSTLTYTPSSLASGSDSFVVVASDGKGGTANQAINVSVSAATSVSTALIRVTGTSGNEPLNGTPGSVSSITGGGGNDAIAGGSRADVAVYSGNRSDYTVTTVAGVTTVRDNRSGSPDGTDTLRGMNILRFADMQLFQSTAANKVILAGQAQTYYVANSEVVQGTNAAEQFIVAPKTSALVFAGNGDTVDLSGAITSYSFARTGTQLQISDGICTTTIGVGGAFTLRTASGSTSVAIDFTAGGAIKLGGTQIVGSSTFDPLAAITNITNMSSTTSPTSSTTLTGTSAADKLSGVSGSVSVITGGGGNDAIAGGSRADVAVYSGNRSDYTVTTVAGVTTVRDNRSGSPDGTDTLRGMNILRFADMQLFQSTAANKVILAGQAQTYYVANSEVVQGTNAAEQFIVAPKTSALVFAGNGDTVDLSGAITSYSFARTGTQLQISDGICTTTIGVGGAFTLRTASGSTSVAIDFTAGGAIKLGGTQIVGSSTFDPLAAITSSGNYSDNAVLGNVTVTNGGTYNVGTGVIDTFITDSNLAYDNAVGLEELSVTALRQSAPSISLNPQQDRSLDAIRGGLSIEPIYYQMSQAYDNVSVANATDSSKRMAIDSIENEITFEADFDPALYDGPQFIDVDFSSITRPESIINIEIWKDLQHGHGDIDLTTITTKYFDDKIPFNTSITPSATHYVM